MRLTNYVLTMNSNTSSTITVILLVFVGLFIWSSAGRGGTAASVQETSDAAAAESSLVTSETSYDFGTISMKEGNVAKEFTVTNPTGADVMVSSVVTSCMCTTAFLIGPDGASKGPFGMAGHGYVPPANELIKAGESRTVRVVFDPNAHGPAGVGRIDRLVALTEKDGGTLEFEIRANVTP